MRSARSLSRNTKLPGHCSYAASRDRVSKTGYRVERSPALELPYLCVDGYDRAPREVKAAVGGLLLGTSVAELEGELVTFARPPT